MKIIWLNALSCNGNTHSFLNYPNLMQFLKDFEFLYHPVFETKYNLKQIAKGDIACDILILEGAFEEGLKKGDVDIYKIINLYGEKVKKIVTAGTCASFGGIFSKGFQNRHGIHFKENTPLKIFENLKNKTVNISGCPIQPEVLANTLYAVKKDYELKLDQFLRPKEYYAFTIHNGCTRNEYFEYKIDNHKFGNLEGCMYYDHGCQAPFTKGSCNKILWNETSSKTRIGQPCVGCSEPDFPKNNLFETKKNMGIPANLPFGVPKRAYLTIAGVAKAFKIDRLEKKLID